MTRKSKPARRRARYPRKRIAAALKSRTGTSKPLAFKPIVNALENSARVGAFIPLIGSI